MAFVRLTIVEPTPGNGDRVQQVLEELDEALAGAPGLLFSLVLRQEPGRLGRISLWQSKEGANREAANAHILSLRSRLHSLSLETEERLLKVKSGHMPAGFASLQDGAMLPAAFPTSSRQFALPAE